MNESNIIPLLPVYIAGDVHSNFRGLLHVIKENDIKNCYFICVGDLGVGFNYSREGELEGCREINEIFRELNIHFMSIRGNHDDPEFFDGEYVNLSHFRLLPDYHYENLNGEIFLFVGGATSIDRRVRKLNVSYWKDESFVLKPELIKPCDVLIAHSAPFWLGEFKKNGILGWCDRDQYLWRDCVKERDELATLFELAKPKKAYVGHFHMSLTQIHNGCVAKILNELEIIEHR